MHYPVRVSIDCEYVNDVAGGGSHSMALDGDGFVYTWGLGEGGRLGHGSNNIELYPRILQELQEVY